MKLTPLYLLSALLLGGCAAMIAPTPQEMAVADYGPYPENYKEIVNDWIHKTFFDPSSVQDLEISEPEKHFIQEAPLMGAKRHFGWAVEVYANGKNRFGGYVGRQHFQLLIRNGVIDMEVNPDSPTGY